MLGMAYVAKKEYARAVEILDALLKEDRNRRAFYARALANFGLKRKNEALADIENAMRMGPEDPHLRDWHARIKALP
jgi:tetratricopeptide (TPR) repeat protein